MIVPDKQISNNFMNYESKFLELGANDITYTNVIPYRDMLQSQYYAFYVLDGKMSLKISGVNGEENITAVLQRGSFYTLCSEKTNKSATSSFFATPIPSVRMLAFTKKQLHQLLMENPEMVRDVLIFYEELIVMLQCEMKDILFCDGRKRLCKHLIQCYRSCGSTEIVTTQETIGKHIGLDRTNVAKYLAELRKENLILTKRNRVCILDLDAIRAIGDC